MFYYVPLEPVQGRYTEQWSRAATGWFERELYRQKKRFVRVEGPADFGTSEVTGAVYDVMRRVRWATHQSHWIADKIMKGDITGDDTIFFDDFYHPGMEAIALAMEHTGQIPVLGSFYHAQSVDKFDFTANFSDWFKHMENVLFACYSKVFVNSTLLKDLIVARHPFLPVDRVKVCGHVFSSDECWDVWRKTSFIDVSRSSMVGPAYGYRKRRVLFTSRIDAEKQPELFLAAAKRVQKEYPEWSFYFCTGSSEFRSYNNEEFVVTLKEEERDGKIVGCRNLRKAEYYELLRTSAFHVSCSLQDWTSFCLLEAVTFSCYPVYPNFRSFPEAFGRHQHFLYPMSERMSFLQKVEILTERLVRLIGEFENPETSHGLGMQVDYLQRDILKYHNGTVERILSWL